MLEDSLNEDWKPAMAKTQMRKIFSGENEIKVFTSEVGKNKKISLICVYRLIKKR